MKKLLLVIGLTLFIGGCATQQQTGQTTGAIAGAVLGGLLGNAVDCKGCLAIGSVVGAVAGSAIGGSIGRNMDQNDMRRVNNSINSTPTGQTSTWVNPDTNIKYGVTPTKTYRDNRTNDYCREVTFSKSHVSGRQKHEEVYGNACRQPDGSWKLQ